MKMGDKVLCRCDCGTEKPVRVQNLLRGNVRSCGCLRAGLHGAPIGNHGLSGHPLYNSWVAIVSRCTKPDHRDWPNYGGRGITVCARWLGASGLANFIADAGEKPSPRHSLDRIDNDGGYEPGNIRWATQKEQLANQRPRVRNSWYDAAVVERERLRQLVRDLGGDPDAAFHQVALWSNVA
jgi:hypothetical protein